jgi:hypothetical protein
VEDRQAHRIKSAYDLANLIIDEASSFFFCYIDDDPESIYFSELFKKAIGAVVSARKETNEFTVLFRASLG